MHDIPQLDDYPSLIKGITGLIHGETDRWANLANIVALLHESKGFFWTGFYRVADKELVLGPFQGPVACTRIAYGKGVCGTAWEQAKVVRVEDVHAFPGHIACSPLSQSEIVVPIVVDGQVVLVLDIDSDRKGAFNEEDEHSLAEIANIISAHWHSWV